VHFLTSLLVRESEFQSFPVHRGYSVSQEPETVKTILGTLFHKRQACTVINYNHKLYLMVQIKVFGINV
jgi:hypothetical protein